MLGNCRKLRKIKIIKTGEIMFVDNYAIWGDLGNGMLQPIRSTQTLPKLDNLKSGQGFNGWVMVDNNIYYKNTSTNNFNNLGGE